MKTFKEYLSEGLFDTSNSRNKPRPVKAKSPLKKGFDAGVKTGSSAIRSAGKALGTTAKIAGGITRGAVDTVTALHKTSQQLPTAQPTSRFQSHSQYKQKVQQRQQQRHVSSLNKKKNKNITL